MKKLTSILLALAVLTAGAFAQSGKTTIRVKVADLQSYMTLLASVDSCTKVVDGKAARVPCDFSGPTRWAIASNLSTLKREIETYTDARSAVIRSLTDGKSRIDPEDAAKIEAFRAEDLKLREAMIDLPVFLIPRADLNLNANPIPATTLAGLDPFWAS